MIITIITIIYYYDDCYFIQIMGLVSFVSVFPLTKGEAQSVLLLSGKHTNACL